MPLRLTKAEKQYLKESAAGREKRLRWFTDARFGMFVHWGVYSVLGRDAWVMAHENIPIPEYEKIAASWKTRPDAAREWARLARRTGMKYMVLTTKHHEGFLLWDSQMTGYNAARMGPGRDLVADFVRACRDEGLKVGLYYSMMDWHHPDGYKCLTDPAARRRFLDFTQGCVRELCSNYGKIDILWYDVSSPLGTARDWESYKMNAMVRKLQPGILINNRSKLDEDFGTPEGEIKPVEGRAWEVCMPLNSSWGWYPSPDEDWYHARAILNYLRAISSSTGNYLLNLGPMPDGSIPPVVAREFGRVGGWLEKNGDIIRGRIDSGKVLAWHPAGQWTRKGNTAYFWIFRWPGARCAISGVNPKPVSIRIYPDGKPLPFDWNPGRLVVRGLPRACPDRKVGITVLEMKFRKTPSRKFPFFYAQTGAK